MRKIATLMLAAALVAASLAPAAATESADFPVTVENCGRMLTFDEPPTRVVTGYPAVFENLVALGLGEEQIIGRSHVNRTELLLPGHKEVYDAVPEVSPDGFLPERETLLALEPDFVIDVGYGGFDAASGYATISELADAGAPAFITGGWCDPESARTAQIASIFDDIRNLGLIFGVPDRAARLTAELEGMLADIERRVGELEPVDVLAIDDGDGPVNAYGGTGLVNQMIELAGGRNVLADIDHEYAEVSAEKVATTSPEAMLVDDYISGRGRSAEEKADTVFALIPDSPAAQDQRFLPVPTIATHGGYHNILAIYDIARFLHPDAFEDA